MEFNNKLYELRKQKGFSQEELANRLNVSRQTVSKWEVGDSTPDMEKLVAISDLFGISLDELVLDKAPEPAPAPQTAKSELYTDIKEKVLTDKNRKKAKKGLKIGAIALGIFLAIDLISFIIYVALNGFPK
ncbi:helix-turn-helix domain-containing protein [Ruminococcus flavefaciens]|uniref:helix-turn-helix domain-containing protein n=1 Tax=Ruminococcus flavefaciens TaxID=1265 RepID=UPI00049069CA|nr:helix-turn-helix transcriptional regulator [Ruminococcus flavefaciens]